MPSIYCEDGLKAFLRCIHVDPKDALIPSTQSAKFWWFDKRCSKPMIEVQNRETFYKFLIPELQRDYDKNHSKAKIIQKLMHMKKHLRKMQTYWRNYYADSRAVLVKRSMTKEDLIGILHLVGQPVLPFECILYVFFEYQSYYGEHRLKSFSLPIEMIKLMERLNDKNVLLSNK